jgi:hypothetical protein
MRRIVLVALLVTACAAVLQADSVLTFYGSNDFGPTFNRPSNTSTLSGVFPRYDVVGFYPNQDASCTIQSTQEGDSYDGHVALYQGSFNPASPLTNLIAVDDDGDLGIGTSTIDPIALDFDLNYWIVSSGFTSADVGTYSVTISCTNPATRVLPASPGSLPQYNGWFHNFKNGRFRVWAQWRDFASNIGNATFVPMGSSDSGIMWFFAPTNWEVLIKILDACDFNNRYWVFYAATTNVEFQIAVYDEEADVVKTYYNPLGLSAPAVTDTNAFATCP